MNTLHIQNNKLAYIDEGEGDCIVFVHGTPVSSKEFFDVIQKLKSKFRCLAIDHLGFGESDKPEDGDYSLKAHRERLRHFLEEKRVNNFHLVITDFGGPIALPLAIEKWSQIKSLTIMNTWAWLLEETELQLKIQKWFMQTSLMKFFYLKLNFSAKAMIKMAWGKHRPLTKEHHQNYQKQFASSRDRVGTWAFLKALFDKNDPTWKVGQELENKEKPVLIIWGEADKFISKNNLERWKTIFPNADVHTLKNVGHFVSDEAPELVAPLIEKFLRNK